MAIENRAHRKWIFWAKLIAGAVLGLFVLMVVFEICDGLGHPVISDEVRSVLYSVIDVSCLVVLSVELYGIIKNRKPNA